MDEVMAVRIHAEARVERGTATACACGGTLAWDLEHDCWRCQDCSKEYA